MISKQHLQAGLRMACVFFWAFILLTLDTLGKMPSGYLLSVAFLYIVFSHFLLFILDMTPGPSGIVQMNSHLDSHCTWRMLYPLDLLSMTTYLKRDREQGIQVPWGEVIHPKYTASNCCQSRLLLQVQRSFCFYPTKNTFYSLNLSVF